ncbi:MAG TPA: DUF1801 domain-containing protein [Vicinamibacterales bacterium]|nr:DUF1801 domain-containing protein [Vicinamibacterales bacterium]
MAQTKNRSPKKTAADTSIAVDDFMATLEHPQKAAVAALRDIVRAADPSIGEGIKWNAPSFRTHEYFATTHLRAKIGIGLILHLGAKVREDAAVQIEDPGGLLAWLGPDRAVVHFADVDEVQARAPALQDVVRQWIAFV